MSVIVTLVEYKGMRTQNSQGIEFTKSFSVGRATDNDLVLDDPDKFSSRYHARVIFQSGRYLIENSSAAGTLINDDIILREGDKFELQDGDVVEIGDSKLLVTVSQAAPAMQDMTSPMTVRHDVTESPMTQTIFPQTPAPPPSSAQEGSFDIDDFFSDAGFDAPSPQPSQRSQSSMPLQEAYYPPKVESDGFNDIDDIFSSLSNEPPISQPAPPQDSSQRTPIKRAGAEPDNSQDTLAIRAFLSELGVEPAQLIGQNKVDVMRVAGVVMRTLTEGMMGVLSARDSVKSQFDMDRTQVKQSKNNPLKFSSSPQEAMAKMLTQELGYLDPVTSANEAVNDAKAHQVAMVSGLNSAIQATISAFDPKTLEKEFNVGFSLSKNAKYWDLYVDRFNKIAKSAHNESNNIFTEQFKDHYEQQIRKISK